MFNYNEGNEGWSLISLTISSVMLISEEDITSLIYNGYDKQGINITRSSFLIDSFPFISYPIIPRIKWSFLN